MNDTVTFEHCKDQHHAISRDSIACAIWSTILEPDDHDAGHLISHMNPKEALDGVLDGKAAYH